MILLQVDPISSDEPETIYESCYKIKHFYLHMVFNS
jgi:hypothetical protein